MTESDFPNIFDDLAIFDEMDKQKLSKKQKKKLKKKKSNKKKPTIEDPKPDKNSNISEENSSLSKENQEKSTDETPEPTLSKEFIEKSNEIEEKPLDLPKNPLITQVSTVKKPLETVKPVQEVKKVIETLKKLPETPKKQLDSLTKPLIEPFKDKVNPMVSKENVKEEVKSEILADTSEFIEVTKKSSKNINSKRFDTLSSSYNKPPVTTHQRQSLYNRQDSSNSQNNVNSAEERFPVEKDSRKKTTETKNSTSSTSSTTKPYQSKKINLINTTEIEIQDHNKPAKTDDIKEPSLKTEHGVTLCKKKHAKEVLMAKIKRKEIEKQKDKTCPQMTSKSIQQPILLPDGIKPIIYESPFVGKNQGFVAKSQDSIDPSIKKECKSLSQRIFMRKMENDLNGFTDNIANECKRMKVFRVCVFERVEFMVSNLFANYNAHIKMYGSCVTGEIYYNLLFFSFFSIFSIFFIFLIFLRL